MTDVPQDFLLTITAEITKRIDAVFESLLTMQDPVLELLDNSDLQQSDLEKLEDPARQLIVEHEGLVSGAGFAVSPGTLKNTYTWMQSWHCSGDDLRFTQHSLNSDSIHFYDYTAMPWYELTVTSAQPILVGPYVDFGGTDKRIITASVPVVLDDRVMGTVVADLSLEKLEHMVLAEARDIGQAVVLVNESGKVIATNSAQILVSGKIPVEGREAVLRPLRCPNCGWRVIIGGLGAKN